MKKFWIAAVIFTLAAGPASSYDPNNKRLQALRAVPLNSKPENLNRYISALKDEDQSLHYVAIKALEKIKSPKAVPPLAEALAGGEPNHMLYPMIVEALGNIGDAGAVEALLPLLKSEDIYTTPAALAKINDKRAVEPLINALHASDERFRVKAAEALGRLKDARAIEPLAALLEEPALSVRWAAADALGRIGGARTVEPLILALKDRNFGVRWSAAVALGEIGSKRAEVPLKALLNDPNAYVRRTAQESLEKLRG